MTGKILLGGIYWGEHGGLRSVERGKVNVLERKCLRAWLECHEWIELRMKRHVEKLK